MTTLKKLFRAGTDAAGWLTVLVLTHQHGPACAAQVLRLTASLVGGR